MSEIFRDKSMMVDGKEHVLRKLPINEIFKFGGKPYIILGTMGAGKTTLAIDIIHSQGKHASKIYYFCATKEALGENGITTIPKLFRREPTFENINNAWQEIKSASSATKKTPPELKIFMSKIYPKYDCGVILNGLENYENKLRKDLDETYKKNDDKRKIKIAEDVESWYVESLTRLILDGVNKHGTVKLDDEDMIFLNVLVSTSQQTILILDDITGELNSLRSDNTKIMYEGNKLSRSKAYESLLIDILTKARRFSTITCVFLHDIQIIDNKNLMQNFVLFDENVVNTLGRLGTINATVKKLANSACDAIFKGKYPHYFAAVLELGDTVCVGKADVHVGDKLELDELGTKLVKLYDSIMSNRDLETEDKGQKQDELDLSALIGE